jgi:hypothetical protein
MMLVFIEPKKMNLKNIMCSSVVLRVKVVAACCTEWDFYLYYLHLTSSDLPNPFSYFENNG